MEEEGDTVSETATPTSPHFSGWNPVSAYTYYSR